MTNPYIKDAEGCTRQILSNLRPTKKKITPFSPETMYFLGKWAGHWGNLALKLELPNDTIRRTV